MNTDYHFLNPVSQVCSGTVFKDCADCLYDFGVRWGKKRLGRSISNGGGVSFWQGWGLTHIPQTIWYSEPRNFGGKRFAVGGDEVNIDGIKGIVSGQAIGLTDIINKIGPDTELWGMLQAASGIVSRWRLLGMKRRGAIHYAAMVYRIKRFDVAQVNDLKCAPFRKKTVQSTRLSISFNLLQFLLLYSQLAAFKALSFGAFLSTQSFFKLEAVTACFSIPVRWFLITVLQRFAMKRLSIKLGIDIVFWEIIWRRLSSEHLWPFCFSKFRILLNSK